MKDLDKNRIAEIEQFFVAYNRVRGKKFKILNVGGPSRAQSLAQAAMKERKDGKKKRLKAKR